MIVLICDDQKSVHTFLTHAINWKALGIDQIFHAYNGTQCLELLQSQTPDILLLDIRMPHMTGIDILKETQVMSISVVTIILSAYSDFSYVKEALTLGAFDYELKPIDAQKLTAILENAMEHRRKLCLSAFYQILNGSSPLDLKLSPDLLAHLNIHKYLGILSVLPDTASVTEKFQLREYFQECYKYVIPLNDLELFILYPTEQTEEQNSYQQIQEQYRELQQLMPSCNLTFGVSQPGFQLSMLPKILEQCRIALAEKFYSGNGFSIYKAKQDHNEIPSLLLPYRSRIYQCLTNDTATEKIPQILDELFRLLKKYRMDFHELTDLCFEILYYNISVILNESSTFELELRQDLKSCKSLEDLRHVMEQIIQTRFYKTAPVLEKTPIQQVHAYLLEHFHEEISLDSMSHKFFISKYALCRGFRQEYGEGLWEFLKRIRMEHARYLLTSSNLKIYEVAEQCGFSDANYFSSTYRKYYHHTPFQEKNLIP